MGRGRKKDRPRGQRPKDSLVERYERRLRRLREALIGLLESEDPGSTRQLRDRPAIEAEIWAVRSQIAVEQNELDLARQCNAEAQRCQAEARKAIALDADLRLKQIEQRLGLVGELESRLEHLR